VNCELGIRVSDFAQNFANCELGFRFWELQSGFLILHMIWKLQIGVFDFAICESEFLISLGTIVKGAANHPASL